MSWHATSAQTDNIAVGGVFSGVLCCSDAVGGGGGGGGGLLALPQKRCGDKLKVTFSSKKKCRAGPNLSLLESAECSMLSVEESAPTSPQDVRYLLLAKHAGTYTHIRLHAKFVQFAPLAVGDEVMFNFPQGGNFPKVPSKCTRSSHQKRLPSSRRSTHMRRTKHSASTRSKCTCQDQSCPSRRSPCCAVICTTSNAAQTSSCTPQQACQCLLLMQCVHLFCNKFVFADIDR